MLQCSTSTIWLSWYSLAVLFLRLINGSTARRTCPSSPSITRRRPVRLVARATGYLRRPTVRLPIGRTVHARAVMASYFMSELFMLVTL